MRIREGWWMMLALCVACGIWFSLMPLLGYGYVVDGVWVRPGWVGVPPCVFGAVFAARTARTGAVWGVLAGVALFALTFMVGAQFGVMKLSREVPCLMLQDAGSCAARDSFERAHQNWDALDSLRHLRSPLDSTTFLENTRSVWQEPTHRVDEFRRIRGREE